MKQITKFKRLLSGVLSAVMTVSAIPIVSAHADESTEPYPYTMFAASSDDGAITVNAGNFCVNGNVATNGTIVSSGNMNINGTRTEHANESMLYVLKKLNYSYFGGENVETYTEDYVLEDLNININNPIDVDGTIELTGNINLNSGIKAVDDVTINGEVKNSNNAVICSETGDINIETSNVSFNGLIYAPYGDIVIDSDNLNLNNVVIIGQTITIDCPNVNANYSSSMAELIGNQSDVDVELYAMGSYNADVNAIDIEWFTNYTNSSYEVLYSDDNENYTSVATVTDATTYQYLITEDFQKRYFKISLVTNYGEVIESIPFVATKSEDGYEVDFLDSDDDGLPDIYEIMIGTDVNLPDTDSDTLTDYQEIYITGTDPTIYDSVVAGISDADADSDEDGLSNSVEITMGTNPQKADTDDDGLNDSEEGTYNTDPLNPDSDGDTLPDGDEPHIGLDPMNPETFDVPDAEYVVSQTIPANSEALRNINTDDSPYTVSLVVDATGYVEGNLTAKETSYAKAISNDAILGIAPEFSCKKNCDVKQATITFSIKNDYVNNEASAFPDEPELQGLKRFMIFSYIEDMNMLLPVETSYDLENNAIYTNTSGLGTYCIMDMEKWLVNLGIEPDNTLEPLRLQHPLMLSKRMNTFTSDESFSEADTQITHTEEVTETESTDESDTSSTSLPTLKFAPTKLLASKPRGEVTVQNPLDLVFLFQINGDLPSTFESQKEMIIADCEDAFEAYNDVRVYLIGYEVNNAKFLKTYNGHTDMNAYCSNIGEVRAALNSVTYVQTSEYCNRGAAFTKMINEVVFRDNAGKFVFQIMNGSTTVNASYFSELDACARGNINYSEVMPSGYHYISSEYGARVNTAITNTGGLNLTYGSDTEVKIYEHIVDNIAPPHIEFNVILPTGWKDISLVDVISPDNYAKSDSDALTDWEEIDTESGLITWDNNGNIQLPTFKKCLEVAKDRGYNVISEYNSSVPEYMHSYFYNEEILPIHSNPCDEDSDGDGFLDNVDIDPLFFDEQNGLLYQSQHKMGIGYRNGEIADDLTINDYSSDEMMNISKQFKYQLDSSEEYLFADFKGLMIMFAITGEGREIVSDLINNFINGTENSIDIQTNDGIVSLPCYTSEKLKEKVYYDEQVQEYVSTVVDEFSSQIKKNNGNVIKAKRDMQNIVEDSGTSHIAFSKDSRSYLLGGMTLSINDLWGSSVDISTYEVEENSFNGVLHFRLYDHFGLDQPDVEKIYVNLAGFRAWFVLQHYDAFNGKYKPFINVFDYYVPFSGTL